MSQFIEFHLGAFPIAGPITCLLSTNKIEEKRSKWSIPQAVKLVNISTNDLRFITNLNGLHWTQGPPDTAKESYLI